MVLITVIILLFPSCTAASLSCATYTSDPLGGSGMGKKTTNFLLVRALLLTLQHLRHKQFTATLILQSQPQNKTILTTFRGHVKLLTPKEKSWDMWQVRCCLACSMVSVLSYRHQINERPISKVLLLPVSSSEKVKVIVSLNVVV